jgi:hypothetical protein
MTNPNINSNGTLPSPLPVVRSTNFKTLDPDTDVIYGTPTKTSYALWAAGSLGLINTFTVITGSSEHYRNITITGSTNSYEYSIAFGHVNGSGSNNAETASGIYFTKTVYDQFRNLLLSSPTSLFNDGDSPMTSVLFISINRNNIKQRLDPGNWELHLSGLITGSGAAGSKTISLIDNSGDYTNTNNAYASQYQIVSGSNGVAFNSGGYVYGLVYPDYGIIALNASKLFYSASADWQAETIASSGSSNTSWLNLGIAGPTSVIKAYSMDMFCTASLSGSYFSGRSLDTVNSQYYFIRIMNKDFNYSVNPSFFTASGDLLYNDFNSDPHVFMTSVGLYDDNNELLAIAKLSKPIEKTFTKEATLQIRLDY